MNVTYSFNWNLKGANESQARSMLEEIRLHAIQMGAESGPVTEVTGDGANMAPPGYLFKAKLPNAAEGAFGLALKDGSWTWGECIRVSSFKEISDFMEFAASKGIEVVTGFAGMTMIYRFENGELRTEQHYALGFDLDDF